MILYPGQYRVHDIDRLDITRGGCERARAAGQPTPGIVFAPSKELLRQGLDDRAAARGNPDEERTAWERYAARYRLEMLESYWRHLDVWRALLARSRVVTVCFCAGKDARAQRCHRFLLAGFLSSPKLGSIAADYRGELTEADRIVPPPGVEPPADVLVFDQPGKCQPVLFTDGSGGGVVCVSGLRRRRCRACGRAAPLLCDFPTGKGKSKTCDAPICERHARTVGSDRHHCPAHPAGAEEVARP